MRPGNESEVGEKGNFQATGEGRGYLALGRGGHQSRTAQHSTSGCLFQSEAGEKRSAVGGRFGRGVRGER
jgi:hypothetical protein